MTRDEWLTFFMDAGIPHKDALAYAVKFAHNRIQINMLPDLNKEYLKEMDITILGDVIAILRHAKYVHEKRIKEDVLLENSGNSITKSKSGFSDKDKSSTASELSKPTLKSSVTSVNKVHEKNSVKRKVAEEDNDIPNKKKTRIETPKQKLQNNLPLSVEEEEIEEFEDMGYIFGPLSSGDNGLIENSNNDDKSKRLNLNSNILSGAKPKQDVSSSSTKADSVNSRKIVSKTLIPSTNVSKSNNKSNNTSGIDSIDGSSTNNSSSIGNNNSKSNKTLPTINDKNKEESQKTDAIFGNDADKDDDDEDDDDDDDDEEDNIKVIIDDPYFTFYDMRTQLNYNRMLHQQYRETAKRKVFERLGDETSQNSVTSTTSMGDDDIANASIANGGSFDSALKATQNSVFLRLGNKFNMPIIAPSVTENEEQETTEQIVLQEAEEEEEEDEELKTDNHIEEDSFDNKLIRNVDNVEIKKIVINNDRIKNSPSKISKKKASSSRESRAFKAALNHLNMDSEGILANPLNEKKLSLKQRLGYNTRAYRDKQIIDLRKSGLYRKDEFDKEFPTYMDAEMDKSKKKVKFGNVTHKIIPNKEEAIRNGELPRIPPHRASVFARLGYTIR